MQLAAEQMQNKNVRYWHRDRSYCLSLYICDWCWQYFLCSATPSKSQITHTLWRMCVCCESPCRCMWGAGGTVSLADSQTQGSASGSHIHTFAWYVLIHTCIALITYTTWNLSLFGIITKLYGHFHICQYTYVYIYYIYIYSIHFYIRTCEGKRLFLHKHQWGLLDPKQWGSTARSTKYKTVLIFFFLFPSCHMWMN